MTDTTLIKVSELERLRSENIKMGADSRRYLAQLKIIKSLCEHILEDEEEETDNYGY